MNFLISLFKKAKKGDNFRTVANPVKYNNQIAVLNSTGDNQYAKISNIVTRQTKA